MDGLPAIPVKSSIGSVTFYFVARSRRRHEWRANTIHQKRQWRKLMLRKLIVGAIVSVALCATALSQGSVGTAAEAKAMLEKAVTELKANETAALAKFNKADGGFRDRDLYVYCFEKATGKFTAQVNASLMGTDVRALKEKDGAPLGQKVFDAAKAGTITT